MKFSTTLFPLHQWRFTYVTSAVRKGNSKIKEFPKRKECYRSGSIIGQIHLIWSEYAANRNSGSRQWCFKTIRLCYKNTFVCYFSTLAPSPEWLHIRRLARSTLVAETYNIPLLLGLYRMVSLYFLTIA